MDLGTALAVPVSLTNKPAAAIAGVEAADALASGSFFVPDWVGC